MEIISQESIVSSNLEPIRHGGISLPVKCLMRMGSRIDLKWNTYDEVINMDNVFPAWWYFTRPLRC